LNWSLRPSRMTEARKNYSSALIESSPKPKLHLRRNVPQKLEVGEGFVLATIRPERGRRPRPSEGTNDGDNNHDETPGVFCTERSDSDRGINPSCGRPRQGHASHARHSSYASHPGYAKHGRRPCDPGNTRYSSDTSNPALKVGSLNPAPSIRRSGREGFGWACSSNNCSPNTCRDPQWGIRW
jgi:hypothetical protein